MVKPKIVLLSICGVLFLIDWGIIKMQRLGLLKVLTALGILAAINITPKRSVIDTKADAFYTAVKETKREDLAAITRQDIIGDLNDKYISGVIPMPLGTDIIGNPINTVYFVNSYYSIPKYLRDEVRNSGYIIYLTTENIGKTELDSDKTIAGLTSSFTISDGAKQDGYIKISDRVNAINISLVHEMGHAIDFMSDMQYSSGIECIRLMEYNELSKLNNVNPSDVSSYNEYFAECLQQYFKNSSNFKTACPKSYDYINNIVNNLRY